MSPLEKVAQAIYRAHVANGKGAETTLWEDLEEWQRDFALISARAALFALRPLDDATADEMREHICWGEDEWVRRDSLKAAFNAAIQHILGGVT
jgi:hypothetical protein